MPLPPSPFPPPRFTSPTVITAPNPRAPTHPRIPGGATDRVLALIVSAQDPGLAVLPTHRVIFGTGRDVERMLPRWREWFEVQPLAADRDPVAALASIGHDRTACLVADRSQVLALLLKPGALPDRLPSLAL